VFICLKSDDRLARHTDVLGQAGSKKKGKQTF
jgi:hypothetical protein